MQFERCSAAMLCLRPLVVVVSLIASPHAQAWGADAHRLIAELAERNLVPSTRAEVERLLGLERGGGLVSISTWADEIRRPASAPLHYVNLPEGDCDYVRIRDCHDGRCVVEAIAHQVTILKSKAPDAERLVALKYVIHLVGDVHQPLHAGLARDKGGNMFQVRAFGRGSNLHAVWDGEMIRRRTGGLAQLMRDSSVQAAPASERIVNPGRWASESCVISRSTGFYPDSRMVDAAYQARWDGVLLERLSLAGVRLAATLNDALAARSVSTAR